VWSWSGLGVAVVGAFDLLSRAWGWGVGWCFVVAGVGCDGCVGWR